MEASDLTLISGDLRGVPSALELSRQTMRTIKQNLVGAFVYNVTLIPVAAGVLYPLWGVLLDPILAAARWPLLGDRRATRSAAGLQAAGTGT